MHLHGSFLGKTLFCVLHSAALADHIDFDLTRILKLSLNLLRYVSCEKYHLRIIHMLRNYHNTDFSTSLDCKGFLNPLELIGNILKLLQSVGISLQCLSSGTWTRRGNRICCLHDTGNKALWLHITVVCCYRIDHNR